MMVIELGFVAEDKIQRAAGEDAIVNMNGEDKGVTLELGQKDFWICCTNAKAVTTSVLAMYEKTTSCYL
jgi:hypothetical protein